MLTELLAPAGNMDKLHTAIRYGADAVYFAGQSFGMRAAADNFTPEEIQEAVRWVHKNGKKAYLTVNTMPHESEYPLLNAYLREVVASARPDALIVADIGVLQMAKAILPEINIHISTQANAVSAAACRGWHALGASRIVLARELSLAEICQIRAGIPDDLELEAFIHGSMCVSYSGRCLLSGFFTGRDANRGMCTQPCRWNYSIQERHFELTEEKRPDIPLPIEEINGETFIMSSKDTCMIDHIPELMQAGIQSFKIEGRMKSAYYVAVVTNTYRMAITAAQNGDTSIHTEWQKELNSVSHREYATGYFYSDPHENPNVTSGTGYLNEKAYLATVIAYNANSGEATCLQRNKFSVGDTVEVLMPGKVGVPFSVTSLYNEKNEEITAVPHPQMLFKIKVPFPVEKGDIVRSAQ